MGSNGFIRDHIRNLETVLEHRFNSQYTERPFPEGYRWTNKFLASELLDLLTALDFCEAYEDYFRATTLMADALDKAARTE